MNDQEFALWVIELDTKYDGWQRTFPKDLDNWAIQNNVRGYDRAFRQNPRRCALPDCQYPIRETEEGYRLVLYGDVCNLCYAMYHAALLRPGLVEAQKNFEENKKRKR